jgi:acylphosphatase
MRDDVVRIRALVRGRVQGVGYRAFTLHHAHRLGLRGTVANRPDGTVECIVEGPRSAVEELVGLLRRGPYHARVDDVQVTELRPEGSLPPMTVTA